MSHRTSTTVARNALIALLLLASIIGLRPNVAAARPLHTPFIPGNLVIYRVGTGVGTLVGTGNPVFLDEYTTAGTLVQSIPMPTSVSGSNKAFFASGTSTSEGLLTRSPDGQRLALTGYASSGGVTLSTSTSAAVNRIIGIVDSIGNVNTSTALTDFSSGGSPRAAVTTNGLDLWLSGGAGGVRYTTLGATTSTQLSTTSANSRQVNIFGLQLYVSSTSILVATVGSGLPTTSGQTITTLPGTLAATSPYGFFFADLTSGVLGLQRIAS